MHPIIFEIGPLTLRSYGLMMAMGYMAGIGLMVWLNRRYGRSDNIVLDLAVWIIVGAIIDDRIMYVLVQPV